MSFNLDELVFKVSTEELVSADKALEQIGATAEKMSKRVSTAQAKAASATKEAAQANDKVVDAEEKATETKKKSVSAIEKQLQAMRILRGENITLGDAVLNLGDNFTSSQSKQLAYLTLSGKTADEVLRMANSFREYQAITSTNTFDNSASGIAKIRKEINELNNVQALAASGISLTRKELMDFMRDSERMSQAFRSEGLSAQQLVQALGLLEQEYVAASKGRNSLLAQAKEQENQAKKAANASIQAAKDQDKANQLILTSIQKLDNAMEGFGTGLNKSSSENLIRFQNALKISGKTVAEQTALLETYRVKLAQVQAEQEKQKVQYIQRALGPQITDIFTGLVTGQPIMTTLLQQFGQIRDQASMAGIESNKLAGILRSSMREMATSIKSVGVAAFSLLSGAIVDTGTAAASFFGRGAATIFGPASSSILQMSDSVRVSFVELTKGKAAAEAYSESLVAARAATTGLSTSAIRLGGALTGLNLLGVAILLGTLAKAAWDVSSANLELSKALSTTGVKFGMNADGATAYAMSLKVAGASTSQVIEVMTEMAKAGGLAASKTALIAEAAVAMQRATGVAISETVKQFKELEKDPVKAIQKVVEEMGGISAAVVYQISQLESVGKHTEAVAIAQAAVATAQKKAAQDIIDSWGPIDTLFDKIGKTWKGLVDFFRNSVRPENMAPLVEQLQNAQAELAKLQDTPSFLKGFSNTKAVDEMKAKIAGINRAMLNQLETTNKLKQAQSEAELATKVAPDLAAGAKAREEESRKQMNREQFINSILKDRYSAEQLSLLAQEKGQVKLNELRKIAGEEFDRQQAKKPKGPQPVIPNTDETKTLKALYLQQEKALSDSLQTELNIQEKYRKYNLESTSETFSKQADIVNTSMKSRLAALNAYSTAETATLNRQEQNILNATKPGTTRDNAVEQINQKRKALEGFIDSQKALFNNTVLNLYIDSIFGAGKAIDTYVDSIQALSKEETKLANKRKVESDQANAVAFASPEQAAYLKGYYAELNRLNEAQAKLNDAAKAAKDGYDSSVASLESLRNATGVSSDSLQRAEEVVEKWRLKLQQAGKQAEAFKTQTSGLADEAGNADKLKYYQSTLDEMMKKLGDSDPTKNLVAGFGQVGAAIDYVVKALQEASLASTALTESRKGLVNSYGEDSKEVLAFDKKHSKMKQDQLLAQTTGFKKFFSQQTLGYKAVSAVESVLRAKSIAETAKEYAVRFGLISEETFAKVAGWVAGANASIGAAATSITSLMGIGSVAGAVAPVVAAAGTPGPAAFAAFAAMAALVASVGFGGKSGGTVSWSNTGTGTVLGDSSAKSESLKGALSKLEDVSSKTMMYSSGMLASLKVIETNTAGLATLLVRSGAASAGDFGITEGKSETTLSKLIGINYGSFLPIIGGLISKISTALFGKKTTINSQGLMAQTGTLGSIFGSGLTGGTIGLSNYADITTKKKFLGVTYSTNSGTQTTAASAETADQFSKIILGFVDSIKLASVGLGANTETILTNLEGFNLDLGKIDLKGLTGTEIQEKLEAVFGALGDKMAQAAFGGLVDFQQVGEGYFETLVRVSSAVEESSLILKKLGISAISYNDVLQKQGDVAAEIVRQSLSATVSLTGMKNVLDTLSGTADEIASAFGVMNDAVSTLKFIGVSSADVTYNLLSSVGGFDSLSSAISSFRENYLTDAQQIAYSSSELSKQFAALGLAMPQNGAEFVNLVKGIDSTTAAGQSLLGAVLGLGDAFSTVANEYTRVQEERLDLESQILSLQGKTSELRAIELSKLDPTNRALQEQIYLLTDQAAATEKLTSALTAAGTAITNEINRLRDAAVGTNSDSLAALQAKFAIATAGARSGDLTSLESLTDLSKSIETAAIASAGSMAQVQQMRAWLSSSLETTASTLGLDLSGLTSAGTSTTSTNVVTATSSGISTTSASSIIDITPMLTELQALRAEVQGLRTEVVQGVAYEAKISRVLDRVTQDGETVSVTVQTP